ncbi:MAG: hypoxanthine phosphoribosyltransferase [Thermodesulfovibrionales bacterium]|nr:hypoxanthine phosphoribosyltransferase [Thermodesulfovibrionales bacterium]
MKLSEKPLLSATVIHNKVLDLAEKISKDYEGKKILAMGMLKGSFIFFADLVRALRVPVYIEFISVSSYSGTVSSGNVVIKFISTDEIKDKDVLLIDDIIDTGVSLNYVRDLLLSKCPRSLKTCVLLDKKERRIVDVPLDYVGFEIPNFFVVGYGLDFNNNFRNLPYITILEEI